jgi:hypothetical protein
VMNLNSTKKYFVKLARTKGIRSIWSMFASASVYLFGPRLAAYWTYISIDWGPFDPEHPTILCISRFHFEKDVHEMRKRTQLNFVSILGGFVRFQYGWFPEGMKTQTYYQMFDGPGKEEAIRKSNAYAKRLLELVQKKRKVSGILSANFDYAWDIGFKNVAKDAGLPFLVLSREHLTIPYSINRVMKWYRDSQYVFNGAGIAVAGKQMKDSLNEIGHIIGSENIHVTGLPRTDAWLEVPTDLPVSERPYITLMPYARGYFCDEDFPETARRFAELSQKYKSSNVKFLVKGKDYEDICLVKEILKDLDVSNIEFTSEKPLFEVFPKSRLVIGLTSLSLVEAVISRAQVVCPTWGISDKDPTILNYNPKDPEIAKCILFPRSLKELDSIVETAVRAEHDLLDLEAVKAFKNKFFFFPENGSSSAEVEKFILRYISNPSRPKAMPESNKPVEAPTQSGRI